MTEEKVNQLVEGIDVLHMEQNPFQEAGPTSETEEGVHMWAGQLTRDHFSEEYLVKRDQLADSAYLGVWKEVFDLIGSGQREFAESWINTYRMSASL